MQVIHIYLFFSGNECIKNVRCDVVMMMTVQWVTLILKRSDFEDKKDFNEAINQ